MKALTPDPDASPRSGRRVGDARSAEPTIYEVAERAGVSIATVSRALRHSAPVADATRERVLAAVEELGFTASRSARSLVERAHAADGLVFPELAGPYFAEVVLGYEEVAGDAGRSVLVLSTHGRQAAPAMVLDLASRVDGLAVLGRTLADEVLLELAGKGLPLVLMAREPVDWADSINAENEASAHSLTTHLAQEHGYRTFEFLGDAGGSPDAAQRWTGFVGALRDAGVEAPDAPVDCRLDEDGGTSAALKVLEATKPRAFVCANDEIALGAIAAVEAMRLRVPDDIAITGWDDVMAARHSRPGLTTVRQPMRELGAWAARRLHARIAGDTSEARHELLPTQLVRRASCGPHLEENS